MWIYDSTNTKSYNINKHILYKPPTWNVDIMFRETMNALHFPTTIICFRKSVDTMCFIVHASRKQHRGAEPYREV